MPRKYLGILVLFQIKNLISARWLETRKKGSNSIYTILLSSKMSLMSLPVIEPEVHVLRVVLLADLLIHLGCSSWVRSTQHILNNCTPLHKLDPLLREIRQRGRDGVCVCLFSTVCRYRSTPPVAVTSNNWDLKYLNQLNICQIH